MKKVLGVVFAILIILGAIFIFIPKDKEVTVELNTRYVSMDEITEIMEQNEGYVILDVRTHEEYNEGHIPNAICIPNETIDESVINELPDKNQLILIYCRSGNRSKQATKKLENLGYTYLVEFGGIIDWNGEVVKQKR